MVGSDGCAPESSFAPLEDRKGISPNAVSESTIENPGAYFETICTTHESNLWMMCV